jgi:hypothetical protein
MALLLVDTQYSATSVYYVILTTTDRSNGRKRQQNQPNFQRLRLLAHQQGSARQTTTQKKASQSVSYEISVYVTNEVNQIEWKMSICPFTVSASQYPFSTCTTAFYEPRFRSSSLSIEILFPDMKQRQYWSSDPFLGTPRLPHSLI